MRLEHFSTGAMMELWKPLGARPRHWGLDLWAEEQTQSRPWPKGPAQAASACPNVPMSPWGDLPVLNSTNAAHKHRALSQPQQQQSPRPRHTGLKTQSPVLGTSTNHRTASRTLPLPPISFSSSPIPSPRNTCCPVPIHLHLELPLPTVKPKELMPGFTADRHCATPD